MIKTLKQFLPWTREVALPVAVDNEGQEQAAINVASPTWKYVRMWVKDQIKDLRERNDSVTLSEVQTAALRGEIRILKALIALPHKETHFKAIRKQAEASEGKSWIDGFKEGGY